MLDHEQILKDCHEVRMMLAKRLLALAKTTGERTNAQQQIREAQKSYVLAPIRIAQWKFIFSS